MNTKNNESSGFSKLEKLVPPNLVKTVEILKLNKYQDVKSCRDALLIIINALSQPSWRYPKFYSKPNMAKQFEKYMKEIEIHVSWWKLLAENDLFQQQRRYSDDKDFEKLLEIIKNRVNVMTTSVFDADDGVGEEETQLDLGQAVSVVDLKHPVDEEEDEEVSKMYGKRMRPNSTEHISTSNSSPVNLPLNLEDNDNDEDNDDLEIVDCDIGENVEEEEERDFADVESNDGSTPIYDEDDLHFMRNTRVNEEEEEVEEERVAEVDDGGSYSIYYHYYH